MRLVESIQETLTSPQTAIPVSVSASTLNWFSYVPDIVNIATAVYLVLLILHKAWQMYKEWKRDKDEQD